MSTTDSVNSPANRPMPNGDPGTWVYLEDIPTPPEVVAIVKKLCRDRGFWGLWGWYQKDWWTRERKLMLLYPGKQIAVKRTKRGPLLLMVAEPFAPELQAFLDSLPRSERREIHLEYVFNGEGEHSWHV